MSRTSPERQRGFGVIAAIVILVILAGLAGFVVSLTTTQNLTLAQDIQGARAYQAAQAGIERGLSRWYNDATCESSTLNFSGNDLQGFTSSVVGTLTTVSNGYTTGGLTTATGSNGSDTITVSSAANMDKGMRVTGPGVGKGAVIKKITGTTLQLTETNTADLPTLPATPVTPITFGIVFCELVATAWPTGTSAGNIGYVERVVRVVAEN